MGEALLEHAAFDWVAHGHGRWAAASPLLRSPVHFWWREERLSRLDGVDELWLAESEVPLSDLVFLSRHAAASGKPSLTVHPIGNPRSDLEAMGGEAGRLAPPSPRLAPMLRQLRATHGGAAGEGLADFDVTFEATHHGPLVRTPALFAEVGSTEAEWGRRDAGRCWAETLWRLLARPSAGEEVSEAVVVVLGGNHYMTQVNALACNLEGLSVGHMLPSYVFNGASEDEVQAMTLEAVRATAEAHPRAREVFVLALKKGLRAAARRAALAAVAGLEEAGEWKGPKLRAVASTKELAALLEEEKK